MLNRHTDIIDYELIAELNIVALDYGLSEAYDIFDLSTVEFYLAELGKVEQ